MTFQNLFSIRKLFSIALLVAFCSQLLTNVKAEESASRELAAPAYTEITAIFATLAGSQDSSTELSVAVNLATGQADAIVYCGGFLTASTTNNKPASLADIYKQGFYAYSSNAYASITMTGLIPATLYNVYCMTVSETDNTVTMPLSVALGKYSLGLTSCCKTATFTSTISSVFTGASTVSNTRALYVSLSNAPSTNVTFSLKLASATTGSTNPAVVGTLSTYSIFVPNTYTPNTPIPVVLVAGEVDTYTITFEAVAGAIVEYNLVGTTTTLSVLSTNTEPNAPVLMSATFSADGTYVTANFDSPTNQGGYANTFSCGALLNFDGSSTATCSWKDPSNIVIYPYYSEGTEVLSLDSRITVVGSKILSYCSGSSSTCSTWNHFASSSVEVKVQASSSANLPTVVVSGPSTVGRCSPIVLDWSSSVGNAGRPWDSVTITVVDPIPNDNVTHVSSFLASDAYTISPPVAIAQTYLIAGHTYTFTGVFCNFLGACGTASKAVYVSDATATPIVSINGLTTRTITSWSTLLVNAAAYTQNCDGSVSVADLTYTWSLFETGVTDTPVTFTSTSQNPAAFKLAPYTLTVGDTYRVQVSVKTSKSESVTASVYVIVAASNLVAVLKDGSSRSIQVGSSYTIDASGSYDQDVVKVSGVAQTGLSYSWSCYQTLPSYSATCPVTLPSVTTGSTLTIATTGATAGRVARITVTVYDATRTTTAYTDITLTEKPSSVITVGSSLTSLTSVNVNQQITLKGSLTLVNACNATWSVDDSSLASKLSSVTLTPTVVRLRTLTPQVNSIELLIPGGVLPQRATLGFSLSCDSVTSVLSMTTNGSPLPGVFVVIPLSGTELTTQFTFSARQWSDPDLPLSYQFGFISPSTGALLNFRGKSESSYAATKLAAGPATSNYAVFTALIVYDVYGASSSVQGNVTVSPAASESAKAAGITSLIAASSGSVDDTNSVIATVGVVLNNVDCTGAPNCASLYRSSCSSVANTCGICLPGYLGVSGSDNSLCLTLDQYKDTGARRLAAGDDCSADASVCLLGRETCQSGKCVAIEKTCPNSCSSKGTCVFSTISTGDPLDTCAITDTSCQAECACDDGYAGTNCGYTAEDMATRQALRSQLIRSLENVTQIDDINELSIQSWATSLSSLSQNAAELTTKEAAIVNNIVSLTIQYATTLGTTDYAALIGLLESLDSAGTVFVTEDRRRRRLGMDRRLTTAGAMDVLTTAGSFSKVVANGMARDQTAATQIHNNFRLSTQINTARTGSTIDVQGPQSDLEYYSNANAPYISLTPGSTSTSVTSSMVLANAANYAGVSMNSNPMQIVIGPDAGLTKITYMVYNNKPTDNLQPTYVSPFFVHDCNTSVYSVFMTCPSGKVLETKCTGIAGKKTQQCDLPSPQCSVFDTSAYTTSKATGCKVLDSPFNPDYTTCECTLVPDGNRRLSVQDVLGETGITNMVTTSTYIATQFTSTFEASTDFTKPEDAQKVLIVILMFAILWSAGILSLCVLFVSRYKRIQKTAMERRRSTKAGGSTTHTVADIKKYLLNYVDKLIPDVYHSAKGKMERAMEETRKHHRYLQLFTARDDQIDVNKRILTLTKMLTVQTMLMFLLAVLYDLQGPDDDGSCPSFDAKSACLNRKSILDSSQNYCQWKIDTNVGYDTCTYNPPNFTLKILIYIIILTSIFTSICNTPIDKLFDMLEAPTEQTVGVSRLVKAGQAVAAGARRASVAGAQMAKAAVANVKQLSFFQKMTKKNPEEDVLAHRRIPDDVAFAHTLAYMALPEISAQAQVTHLQQTVASNEIRSVAVKRMNQIRGSDKKGVNKDEVRGAEAVAEPVKKDIDRSMDQLLEEIMQQRLILPADSEETTEFDTQWGIEKSVSQDARTVSTSLFVNSESLKGISKDVTGSDEKMKELKQKMQNFSDNQAGLDILHLFMVDLLGRHTLAAKIFENKFEEDFERTDVVSKPMKWFVVFLIICVNGFFMYYSLLKGFTKGIHWQNQYLGGCITQLFIEIFLFETLECIWINYWVPDLVSSEVMRAGTVLKEAAEKISLADKNAGHQDAETTKYFLDAPSYLFVSTKLAKAFPKLLESIIVTSYRNHLPGEIARTWRNQHSNGKSYKVETEMAIKKTFGGNGIMGTLVFNCIVALTSTIVIALQALGSLPYFYQRIIIRIVQPVLLSGLTLLWYFAVHNPILFAVIGSLIAITIMVLFLRYKNRLAKAKMAKVQPVNPSSSRMREKVRDMGEAKVNEMVPVGTSLSGPLSAAPLSGKKDAKDASSMASSEDAHAAVQPAAAAAAPKRLPNVAEDDSSSDYSY